MSEYGHVDLGDAGIVRVVPYDPTEDLAELAWEHASELRPGCPVWVQDQSLWSRTLAKVVGDLRTEDFWVQVVREYLAEGGTASDGANDANISPKQAG